MVHSHGHMGNLEQCREIYLGNNGFRNPKNDQSTAPNRTASRLQKLIRYIDDIFWVKISTYGSSQMNLNHQLCDDFKLCVLPTSKCDLQSIGKAEIPPPKNSVPLTRRGIISRYQFLTNPSTANQASRCG